MRLRLQGHQGSSSHPDPQHSRSEGVQGRRLRSSKAWSEHVPTVAFAGAVLAAEPQDETPRQLRLPKQQQSTLRRPRLHSVAHGNGIVKRKRRLGCAERPAETGDRRPETGDRAYPQRRELRHWVISHVRATPLRRSVRLRDDPRSPSQEASRFADPVGHARAVAQRVVYRPEDSGRVGLVAVAPAGDGEPGGDRTGLAARAWLPCPSRAREVRARRSRYGGVQRRRVPQPGRSPAAEQRTRPRRSDRSCPATAPARRVAVRSGADRVALVVAEAIVDVRSSRRCRTARARPPSAAPARGSAQTSRAAGGPSAGHGSTFVAASRRSRLAPSQPGRR